MKETSPIPQPKTFGPLGNLPLIDKDKPTLSLIKLAEEQGPIFQIHTPAGTTIVVSGHELVKEVCDEERFDKSIEGALEKVRAFSGDGLFTSWTHEPNWRKAHNILMPTFSQRAMKDYHEKMVDIAVQLIQKWARLNPNEAVDVPGDMTRLTLDTIGLCGFNYRFNSYYRETPHPFINSMVRALDEAMHQMQRLDVQDKLAYVCITGFNPNNGFLTVSVLKNGIMTPIASVSHGMRDEEKSAIREIMEQHGHQTPSGEFTLEPSICAAVQYLTILQGTLREVSFIGFEFQMDWTECTYAQVIRHSKPVHPKLQFTSLDKIIFEKNKKTKEDFIQYMIEVSDYLLPFLKNRAVTVIRYPHGSRSESFFQKNKPDYAPDFVQSFYDGSHEHIVCEDMSTLLWLCNQLALEFHVPFQTIKSRRPAEIVIDLDPPSRDDFLMAVQAANELKRLLDSFGITSYPKLSGNKGIQLYIPLSPEAFTYEETRQFTQLIAEYCTNAFPELFTTERLIKNRHCKLYLDYLQHAEGKTIICPYSTRGNELGTVAAPLYWHEVQSSLTPALFTIDTVIDRIKKQGCPFFDFYRNPQDEPLSAILHQLKKKS